ncbi:MAG: hypothetical protein Q8L68_05070, partial [Methylococcales bacterium]|nr:hypothetical protein [Methylococcales bacterium]
VKTQLLGFMGKEAKTAFEDFFIEGGREAATKPLTVAGNIALMILTRKVIGGAVSKAPVLAQGIGTGKVARQINAVNILGAGLATAYGIDVAGRYAEAPNKAAFLGGLTFTELVPFAVGGYLGTKGLPKLPYTISTKKPAGVLFEIKNMYSTPGEYFAGRALVTTEPGIIPGRAAIFASETKGGLTDIYLRPTKATAKEWLSKLQGHAEYVNTRYGSYLNIRPTALKTIPKEYKLLASQRTPGRMEVNEFLNNPVKDVWYVKEYLTPVFEKMGVNIATLGGREFKVNFVSAKLFPKGVRARYNSELNTIELRRGTYGRDVIYDISHEIGHAITKTGALPTQLPGVLAVGEASAASFEGRFINTFNNLYKTSYKSKVPFEFILKDSFSEYSLGSYAGNIRAIGKILKSDYKLASSQIGKTRALFQSVGEGISKRVRLERKLDISPARLQLTEVAERLSLPEKTWDYDIVADILRP